MAKKITPFLVLSVLSIISALYLIITKANFGWGFVVTVILIFVGIILLSLDFVLKILLQRYLQLIFLQLSVILIIALIFWFQI